MRNFIIQTPEFRLAWPSLDKPYSFIDKGNLFYGATALFDEGYTPANMARACQLTAEDYFGKKKAHAVRQPFKEGKAYEKGPDYSQFMTVTMKNKNKPLMRVIEDDEVFMARAGDFYPGVFCAAEVMAYAYDHMGHRGVALALLSITRLREAELTEEQASLVALSEAAVDPLLDL